MIKQLKLVIWDLDDTFWNGTLSEGKISLINENVDIIRLMTDQGIVNSICSKNDLEDVRKVLSDAGLWEFFVFPSIDWSPKGERIKTLIRDMNLRAENVLFVDDNKGNLQEALYYNEGLQILDAADLKELYHYVRQSDSVDPTHKRLKQYHILEKKKTERADASSNEEFLMRSDIHVYIDRNCRNISRITELIARTNQLNYTKLRIPEEDVRNLISDKKFSCGCVFVKDRFGDYGMVGFYCLDTVHRKLLHYLFSCRTLGMGIEQWVYQKLNYPNLTIREPVTVRLQSLETVTWITEDKSEDKFYGGSHSSTNGEKRLVRGGQKVPDSAKRTL